MGSFGLTLQKFPPSRSFVNRLHFLVYSAFVAFPKSRPHRLPVTHNACSPV